jgi:hypothetical protein
MSAQAPAGHWRSLPYISWGTSFGPAGSIATGATGTVGCQIVEILAAEGGSVDAVSRDPSRATWPQGTTPVKADPSSPSSLTSVLKQTNVLFLNPATTSGLYAPAGDSPPAPGGDQVRRRVAPRDP